MSAIKRLNLENLVTHPCGNYSPAQAQTEATFAFKWAKRETYESQAVKENLRKWLFEKYCQNDPQCLDRWLAGPRKVILDAGCGAAVSAMALFGELLKDHDYLGIDISDSVAVAKKRFDEAGIPGDFLQVDLMDERLPDCSFDIIFSEGVLHHTNSTESALKHLARKLKPSGRFLFYVYARKGPIREFTDDFIREKINPLSEEEAWEALKPLTKLGETLGKLDLEIDIPEDIPLLEIKKGKISLQRFFYWHVCKMYYRPEFSPDEMNHINFDWFPPLNCHRQTPDQVRKWCEEASLIIEHINVQESGITIVAKKGVHKDCPIFNSTSAP